MTSSISTLYAPPHHTIQQVQRIYIENIVTSAPLPNIEAVMSVPAPIIGVYHVGPPSPPLGIEDGTSETPAPPVPGCVRRCPATSGGPAASGDVWQFSGNRLVPGARGPATGAVRRCPAVSGAARPAPRTGARGPADPPGLPAVSG